MKIAVYPGSFNPITNGHIDILERALKAFDKVIILVAVNRDKNYAFTAEERVDMIRKSVAKYDNVEVRKWYLEQEAKIPEMTHENFSYSLFFQIEAVPVSSYS